MGEFRSTDFILINDNDNVIIALRPLKPGDVFCLKTLRDTWEITVRDRIPFGHKCAARTIPRGEKIIKYGEPIGIAVRDITTGEHVHVHNLISIRGTVRHG